MPIVLLVLLNFLTVGAQESCNPLELEKQCFSQICKVPTQNLILKNAKELKALAAKAPAALPKDAEKYLDRLTSITKKIQSDARAAIGDDGYHEMANDILQNPEYGQGFIESFFKDSLKCLSAEPRCELIVNDMDPFGQKLREVFPKLKEYSRIKYGLQSLKKGEQNDFLVKAMEKVAHLHPKDFSKNEKAKILASKEDMPQFPWLKQFHAFAEKDLSQYQAIVATALKQKTNELLTRKISKEAVAESCRLNSVINSELGKGATKENFEKLTLEASKDFHRSIVTKLSAHSQKTLSENLTPDLYRMIGHGTQSIAPQLKILADHLEGYRRQEAPEKILLGLLHLPTKDQVKCNSAALIPKDYYSHHEMKIYVSPYALANKTKEAVVHELGHWLSAMISKKKLSSSSAKKITDLRKCVRKFYALPEDTTDDDLQTTEEDFADWIASQVDYKNEIFCDMEKIVSSAKGPGDSAYVPLGSDDHSNQLFRELHIRMNRGLSVPQSCRDLMNAYPDFAPAKCEFK